MTIENITTQINDAMKQLFIDTLKLYEADRQFNYENYGRYPYRDRKNSVEIFADFSTMSYSVNGLFVDESEYSIVYPPIVISRLETVLAQTHILRIIVLGINGEILQESESTSEIYQLQEVKEYIEVEDTTVQTIQYLFPFTATQNMNDLILSFD